MKKIAYLINSIKVSGPNRVLNNMIKGIDKNKYEVFVISFLKDDDVEVKKLKMMNVKTINLGINNKIGIFLEGKKKLQKVIEKNNIDIIHSHGLFPDFISSKIKNVKHISTLHCNVYEDYHYAFGNIYGWFWAKFHIYYLNKLDHIICCSKSVYDSLNKKIKANVSYIRNGISSNENDNIINYGSIRKGLKISKDDIIYLYVGGLIKRKNVLYLAKKMNSLMNDNEHFIILGNGEFFEEIKKINNNNIHLVGYKKNVYDYLNESNVYISASKSEGLSISIIEALEKNLYLFLSNIPSHNEFFEIDTSKYIGESFNEVNFEKKLNNLRERIKVNLKNKDGNIIKNKYLSEKSMMKEYERVYEK